MSTDTDPAPLPLIDPAVLLAKARKCANVYARQRSAPFDEDMVADAALGGWKALSTWKPDGGSALDPYLWMRMSHEITDGLRRRTHLKRDDMERVQASADGWDVLPASHQTPASLSVLLEVAGFDAVEPGDPYAKVDDEDLVRHLLANLPLRERDVVVRNVLGNETLASIGASYGFSEARACQIKRKALDRMFDLHERTVLAA